MRSNRLSWFLICLAVIPFVFVRNLIDPAFTTRAILLAVFTIATFIASRDQSLRTSPLVWIWCVYAAFCVASIFIARNSGEAIYSASLAVMYGAWLLAAMQKANGELLPHILRTVSIIGLLVSLVSLLQFYARFDFFPGGEGPFASMAMKNLMSSFLFLTLPATLYGTLSEEPRWKPFCLLTLAASMFVLLIAQTRAVWLGSVVMASVALALLAFSSQRRALWQEYRSSLRNIAMVAVACLLAIFVFNIAPRHGSHAKSATEKASTFIHYSSDTSSRMRLTVWSKSIEMFRNHPILGVGAGNWKIQLPSYGLAEFPHYVQDGSYQWTETHNDFLEHACESGVGGGLAYLALFVAGVSLAIRAAWRAQPGNSRRSLLMILLAATISGYAIISFFDFPGARVEHTILFLLWLSILPSTRVKEKEQPRNRLPLFVAILLVIPALMFSIQRFIAEQHEVSLLQARLDQDWNTEIAECNKIYDAKLLSVDALSTPLLYYRAEAEYMLQDYPAALRDNLEALRAHPNHFYTLNNTGSCYVKLRNFQAGEVFYNRALAISPNFEESLLNLTAVSFNQQDYARARSYLNKCDTTQPGSRAAMYAQALNSLKH